MENHYKWVEYAQILGCHFIRVNAGFRGFIGIEYEGSELSENMGVLATKELLIKSGSAL